MTESEIEFIKAWEIRRKKWKWSRVLFKISLFLALPLVVLIDLVNFFIVGDVLYPFFSFSHLLQIIQNLIIFSLILGIGFGAFTWYSNEIKFQKLKNKEAKEKKETMRNF